MVTDGEIWLSYALWSLAEDRKCGWPRFFYLIELVLTSAKGTKGKGRGVYPCLPRNDHHRR